MSFKDLLAVLFLASLLTSCIIPEKNRDTVQSDYADKYPARSFYLYQSVLRIANVNQEPDINKLIKDLDRVDVHLLNGSDPKADFKALVKDLRADHYEDLISARTKDLGQVYLKSKNRDGKDKFVLLGDLNGKNIYVEFQGILNLNYIGALADADWSKLTDQLGGNNFGIIDEDVEGKNRRRPADSAPKMESPEAENTTEK